MSIFGYDGEICFGVQENCCGVYVWKDDEIMAVFNIMKGVGRSEWTG